jgi:hypothetical protein
VRFDRSALEAGGFTGWKHFRDLPSASVPARRGVYLVLRESLDPPTFLARSPAGHFKGRDPTVPVSTLAAKWVTGARVMNIGMATTLRQRLDAYRRYGEGQPVGHQGGRYIWQLADSDHLLVAWKATEEDPADAEASLIRAFMNEYGALPFANLNAGRRLTGAPTLVTARPAGDAQTFVVAGRAVTVSADDVRQALRDLPPEPVQVWGVEVDGTLYPVVQALEAVSGVPRGSTRSARARDVLSALGFRLIRV